VVQTARMRILVMSLSGLGHVHPMVPLALAAQARGHELRWLTGPDAVERLASIGIAAHPVGIPFESLRAEYWERYPGSAGAARSETPDHVFPHLFGEIAPSHTLPDAVSFARDWRPDLVVHDAADFAGPIVAAVVGVPSVTHAFGALTPIARVADAAIQVAPYWRSVGLQPRPFGGLYDHLYLDIYPPSLQLADMAHVPRRQLERPGGTETTDGRAGPPASDIADGRPLVYLTFGTVYRDRPILSLALAAAAELPVRVLVTVGPFGDPAALGPQPDHVRVERYVPQSQVLPQAAVVVSHSGSGTFLGAAAHGVPQLCLPQAADQFLNATAGVRAGIALALDSDATDVTAIGVVIRRLLDEPAFRDRASVVAGEIAAMPGPEEVVPVLEALADRS
jgi:UDP:flavonoid glycosyltransferase YjiC (YdhE family)